MKVIHGRAIHENSHALKAWRQKIALAAKMYGLEKTAQAVAVYLTFVLIQPKTVTRERPSVRPDIDKLTRAVLDGLTGIAYDDDQQVCRLRAEKIYHCTKQGVAITVRPI